MQQPHDSNSPSHHSVFTPARLLARNIRATFAVAVAISLIVACVAAPPDPDPGLERPQVTASTPADGAFNVPRDASVTTVLYLPNSGVDPATVTTSSVRLTRASDGALVLGAPGTSGGSDSLFYSPEDLLASNTTYRFQVTDGARDVDGARFEPFDITFTTGEGLSEVQDPEVTFDGSMVYGGDPIASLAIGPDGKLYGTTLLGAVLRWRIASDGSLEDQEALTGIEPRFVIGIDFEPSDTEIVVWISHNQRTFGTADDWTGAISRVTISSLDFSAAMVEDYVVGLPRSVKDHLTNSVVYHEGYLYVPQGSHTSAGEPDAPWGMRPERLLTAAVLRIDPSRTTGLPIDVRTAEGGSYDPYGVGAPVTLYATGVRNAYDLVWHRSGHLYAPTNGSNAGGNTPASPDGTVPALENVDVQPDFVYLLEEGRYYGHPNPLRGEYILLGGNPTGTPDRDEVLARTTPGGIEYAGYPLGTMPDENYRGYVERFCCGDSINGVIEYHGTAFGGVLEGKLLIVRYVRDDMVALAVDPLTGALSNRTLVALKFDNPLDLVEDRRNGNLYVAELINQSVGGGRIALLKVADTTTTNRPPVVEAGSDRTTTVGAAIAFAGSFSDDGGVAGLTFEWRKVLGPGTVAFGSPTASETTATFGAPGLYVLEFVVHDGTLTTADAVTIEVAP